ncbi:MAG: Clp protease ClpP, partial [Lentisphaeria bacterium]|nr:Clp protease ClpP [Lentisphaeria bacterium]
VKTDGQKSRIDLFGYVGGSKVWNDGFNEKDFLDEFRAIPEDNEIDISINSFGGSVFTALSIYELLKSHKGAITFRVDGVAMSAATIITSVPGAKVIMPNGSLMMIHKVSSIAAGNAEDFRKAAEIMDKLEDQILNIYAEKTGKTVDEIKPLVDAETYFDATEAVEFGLADETDETKTVENKKDGNRVMVNGLAMDAKFFEHAPQGFINKADAPIAPAQTQANKEDNQMTLEKLKAEHPDIVDAIRNELAAECREEAMKEGAEAERTRIMAIHALGITGHDDLVADAINNGKTDGELAVAVMKAQKAQKAQISTDLAADAKPLAGVVNTPGNEGIMPGAEQAAADEKARKEAVAHAAKAFANK